MNSRFSRISENVLFAALLAAVIGWTAAAVAVDAGGPAEPSLSCAAAKIAAGPRHS